jgi:hypothetical protein
MARPGIDHSHRRRVEAAPHSQARVRVTRSVCGPRAQKTGFGSKT